MHIIARFLSNDPEGRSSTGVARGYPRRAWFGIINRYRGYFVLVNV